MDLAEEEAAKRKDMNKKSIGNVILGIIFAPAILIVGILISPALKRRKEDLSKQIPKNQQKNSL